MALTGVSGLSRRCNARSSLMDESRKVGNELKRFCNPTPSPYQEKANRFISRGTNEMDFNSLRQNTQHSIPRPFVCLSKGQRHDVRGKWWREIHLVSLSLVLRLSPSIMANPLLDIESRESSKSCRGRRTTYDALTHLKYGSISLEGENGSSQGRSDCRERISL